MFGSIPEMERQIPEFGSLDEIQNYLHRGANAHDLFGVMATDTIRDTFARRIVCPELVGSRHSARAVMCVKTLANYIEIIGTPMTIAESYRLCCHKSKLPC